MPAQEFLEWEAYYNLEPFGAERDNFHSATLAALLVNTNRSKGMRPASYRDFMLSNNTRNSHVETMRSRFLALAEKDIP